MQRGDERGNGVRRGDHRRDEAFQDANLLDNATNARAITSQVEKACLPPRRARRADLSPHNPGSIDNRSRARATPLIRAGHRHSVSPAAENASPVLGPQARPCIRGLEQGQGDDQHKRQERRPKHRRRTLSRSRVGGNCQPRRSIGAARRTTLTTPSALVLSFGGYSPEVKSFAWGFTCIPHLPDRSYACVLDAQGETTDDAGSSHFRRDSRCDDHPGIR